MISHIEVCNRFRAESAIYPRNTAIISITDIGSTDANIHGTPDRITPDRILRLKFDDIDPKWWAEIGANVDESRLFNDCIARDIKLWTNRLRHSRQTYKLVIHCERGISRSGAIAKAISEATGLQIASTEKLFPNPYVFEIMREILREKSILRTTDTNDSNKEQEFSR